MNTGKKKILVIDDSNTNVVLLEAILKNHGYMILTAMSVREAYEILDNEHPVLILLDLLMPNISGYQFLQEIKKHDATREIPVIVVSAITDKLYRKKIEELGAAGFIEKPIDIHELVEKVEISLSN